MKILIAIIDMCSKNIEFVERIYEYDNILNRISSFYVLM